MPQGYVKVCQGFRAPSAALKVTRIEGRLHNWFKMAI